ncbi:hypothetical protein FRX31_019999 [Thalictrum thalictroides]|uniref:Uncharacterized protein n=1 Tax=Thalictrum thalictroides TaxID=46969 RepID=A0A7J6VZY7_THATH|nr:hypothetical protein FRX31_019999 [Thalictrum thalictroides]
MMLALISKRFMGSPRRENTFRSHRVKLIGLRLIFTQLIVANKELHWLSIDIDHEALGVAAYQRYRPSVAANQRYRPGVAPNQRYRLGVEANQMYRTGIAANQSYRPPVSYYIFSIHTETGDFKRIKVPPYLANPDLLLRFKGHRECYHILSEVKFNGAWSKTQNVCLKSLLIGEPSTFLESFLSNEACIVPSRDFINSSNSLHLMTILIHHEDGLFLYDLKSQQWRKMAFLRKRGKAV